MVAATCLALMLFSATGSDSTGCTALMPTMIRLQVVPVAPITPEALDTLINEAAAIWRPYNISIVATRDLSRTDNDRDGKWMTLVVRDGSANRLKAGRTRGYRALATIEFDNHVPGDVIYASLECARQMVNAAGLNRLPPTRQDLFAARLLGRAVAHELGHYLFAAKKHSARGLMRASFGVTDLLTSDLKTFRLEPNQLVTLLAQGR